MLRFTASSGIFLLASLTALGPLALDMYLPALPAIAAELGASSAEVQLTLSVYMAGFALAQLAYGPVSDRFGRKPALLFGLGLFALSSVLCALAPNIEALLTGRFLQALGGAAGPVLGRAIVRDVFEPREGARVLSYISGIMAVAPALAPIIGGLMLAVLGWGSIFYVLACYAAFVALLISLTVEPLPTERRQSVHPLTILRNYRTVIVRRSFLAHALTNAAVWSGLFAFLSGAPFVLIDFMGVPARDFGFYFAVVVAGFFLGTMSGGRLTRRLGGERLIFIGSCMALAGGATMAGLAFAAVYHPLAVVLPHALFLAGAGIVMPQTTASALAPFPRFAGAAASLFGCIQLTIGVSVGTLVGQLADPSPRTMTLVIASVAVITLISAVWAQRVEAGEELEAERMAAGG